MQRRDSKNANTRAKISYFVDPDPSLSRTRTAMAVAPLATPYISATTVPIDILYRYLILGFGVAVTLNIVSVIKIILTRNMSSMSIQISAR